MSRGPWQPHKRAAARVLAKAGWTPKQMAIVLDVPPATAGAWSYRPPPRIRNDEALAAEAHGLRAAGWSLSEIGWALRRTDRQIERLLVRHPLDAPAVDDDEGSRGDVIFFESAAQ